MRAPRSAWGRCRWAYRSKSSASSKSTDLDCHYRFAVVAQLFQGIVDVGEGLVLAVLGEALGELRLPALHQLLQRRHVEVAIVEIGFELRHPAREEAPILADRVAAHRRSARGDVGLE